MPRLECLSPLVDPAMSELSDARPQLTSTQRRTVLQARWNVVERPTVL